MVRQLSLEKTFIISIWLEALVYGIFFTLFCATIYVNFTLRRSQDAHSRAMFFCGVVFFIIATLHLGMNCFRMVRGYVEAPQGPVAYIGDLRPWDHIFKDTLYATQEILGDGVAIYRCWVIWSRDWKVTVVPLILWIVSIISGYTVCGLYPTVNPQDTVFNPRLTHWITTFYSIAVVQSAITTGLMAYRIWATDRRSASYRTASSNLLPIVRILIESASLQFLVEVLLLSLYSANLNAQYILLEIVTPLVGITFAAITIRLSLRMSAALDTSRHAISHQSEPIATIGSLPMRPIAVNITKDVHLDDRDRVSELNYKIQPDGIRVAEP